jgi:iron complex transport system substrate-binding protein
MRIASLVPSATEMCFALGLGEQVVAVTHECDHPPAAKHLPTLTRSVIDDGLDPGEIDRAVRERTERGESLYELDTERLAALEVDLIVTQEVCAVCAVSYEDVLSLARRLPGRPEVVSLDPSRLGEVLDDATRLAAAAGAPASGRRLRAELADRIDAVTAATAGAERPRVVALEWLEPAYAAGHWVPEMIGAAGGEDALASPGERSRVLEWERIAAAEPDVVVVMPCGLYCAEAAAEGRRHRDRLGELGAGHVYAVDAAASFSRPGPRLADGVELLGHLLHPEAVGPPAGLAFEPIAVAR